MPTAQESRWGDRENTTGTCLHGYATALNQPNVKRPRVKEFCLFSENAVLGQIFYSTQAAAGITVF